MEELKFNSEKLSHNDIAKICRDELTAQGLLDESNTPLIQQWEDMIYNFAKENDEKKNPKMKF